MNDSNDELEFTATDFKKLAQTIAQAMKLPHDAFVFEHSIRETKTLMGCYVEELVEL